MKKKIELNDVDHRYLLFYVDGILYEINQKDSSEDLFETICSDLDETIESFQDCWSYSRESHYTTDSSYPLTPENLNEHTEYIVEWISYNENRWELPQE